MKIAILSDIHIESWQFAPPITIPKADLFVLAGDVGEGFNGIDFIHKHLKDRPCIYVPGNHEYYYRDLPSFRDELLAKSTEFARGGVFDNQVCIMSEGDVTVRFICATLWSSFSSMPTRHDRSNGFDQQKMQNRIFDFRVIGGFSYQESIKRYEESLLFIAGELEKSFAGVTIVVTHFAPHLLSIAERYSKDGLTAYFVNDLPDELVNKADYWIHGHTHSIFDYKVGDCRVICQPFGYQGYYQREAGCANKFKVINVKAKRK